MKLGASSSTKLRRLINAEIYVELLEQHPGLMEQLAEPHVKASLRRHANLLRQGATAAGGLRALTEGHLREDHARTILAQAKLSLRSAKVSRRAAEQHMSAKNQNQRYRDSLKWQYSRLRTGPVPAPALVMEREDPNPLRQGRMGAEAVELEPEEHRLLDGTSTGLSEFIKRFGGNALAPPKEWQKAGEAPKPERKLSSQAQGYLSKEHRCTDKL